MSIEVWTPRGIEMVDEEDFAANWTKVKSGGLIYDAYDRIKTAPPTTEYRYVSSWQPVPLSMVIIGAISVGFVIGCAI